MASILFGHFLSSKWYASFLSLFIIISFYFIFFFNFIFFRLLIFIKNKDFLADSQRSRFFLKDFFFKTTTPFLVFPLSRFFFLLFFLCFFLLAIFFFGKKQTITSTASIFCTTFHSSHLWFTKKRVFKFIKSELTDDNNNNNSSFLRGWWNLVGFCVRESENHARWTRQVERRRSRVLFLDDHYC